MGLADRDYMRERYGGRMQHNYAADVPRNPGRKAGGIGPVIGAALVVCSFSFSIWRAVGSPDLPFAPMGDGPAERFPDSGTVTVSPLATTEGPRSTFNVEVPPENPYYYVVRLDRPDDDRMVISIFVRPGDAANVPVPAGSYKVRFSFGRIWHGPRRLFGRDTRTQWVVALMTANPRLGAGIKFSPGDLISMESSSGKFRFGQGHVVAKAD